MLKKRSLLAIALASFTMSAFAQDELPSVPKTFQAPPTEVKSIDERVKELEKDVKNIKKHGKFEDIAIDKANATSSEVLSWTQEKLLEVYSYNFMNYQDVIKYIKHFFTQPGYDSYLKALDDSKNREVLESQKLIVYAIPAGGAKVEREGIVEGIYEWDVKVPLLVSYRNDHGTIQRKLDVNVIVVRVPYTESERGYALHAIRAKEVTEEQPKTVSTPDSVPATPVPAATPVPPPSTNITTPKIVAPKPSEPTKPAVKQ